MPQISFGKTIYNIEDILDIFEDRLIVQRIGNQLGKIYYEFSDTERLEIQANSNSYYSMQLLNTNPINIDITKIVTFDDFATGTFIPAENISKNSIIFDGTNIGIITAVSSTLVTIKTIFTPTPLKWNDYY